MSPPPSFLRRFFVALLALTAAAMVSAQELRKLRDTGPNANRVNVVLLGDGYIAAESGKFFTDAQEKLAVVTENEAFVSFKDVINGFAIFVASADSGTDIPSESITRNTYFNTSFGTSGIDRLLAISDSTGRTRLSTLLTQNVPDYDIVILLVNSTKHGGSGGFPATISLNLSSDESLLHEIGHSFARLEDEYVDAAAAPTYPPKEGINATQKTDRAQIPWANFTLATTPVPTPGSSLDANYVGSFEGAYYRATGFYRPTYDSKMRSLGRPFGPVNIRAFSAALQRLNLNSATATATLGAPPFSQAVPSGGKVTLSIAATGVGPFTYQWMRDGKFVAGATSSTYTIGAFSSAAAGDYLVEVTNARGSVLSGLATLSVATGDSRLAAISCRAVVGAGGEVLIPGLIVGGTGQRQVVVRASGPAILGVTGTLARPQLKFYRVGMSDPIATNTGWSSGTLNETNALRAAFASVNLPAYADGSGDCALLATLDAGAAYTAVVSGLNDSTGVALIEVYELATGSAYLTALSCRARVGTGGNILIPGIIVAGSASKQLLIRASAPPSVEGSLAQPQLTLLNSAGTVIATNTGWSNAANAPDIFSVTPTCGLTNFAPGSPNCAILTTLPPGGYTAQISGVNSTTGVALIEVYEVP